MKVKLLALIALLTTQGLSAYTWKLNNTTPFPIKWKLDRIGCADTQILVNGLETKTKGVGLCLTKQIIIFLGAGDDWNRIYLPFRQMGLGWTGHNLTFAMLPKITKERELKFVPILYLDKPYEGRPIPEDVYNELLEIKKM